MKDFFISYTKADIAWAEWIAWQLENTGGYTTVIQAWDFHPGSNFISEMHKALIETHCTIAVLSPAFLNSIYTEDEWTASLVKRQLIMVRVDEVNPPGLLSPLVYIDLVGLEEHGASKQLLGKIKRERLKPDKQPAYPCSTMDEQAPRPRYPKSLPPIWNISLSRNPNFSGRDEYLSKLEKEFNSEQHAALTQAIIGIGGVGKTQIAIEYSYRYSTNYQAIWWIKAENEKTLAADFAAFAAEANLPEKDSPEELVVIRAVKKWLEHNQGWLLVFDNAESPDKIIDYLPHGASGQVLITSRHKAWGKICHPLRIKVWPRKEAVEFLINRTTDKNHTNADKLAEELGDLPLALEQAAAFINEASIWFDDYLKLYRTRRKKLWDEESPPLNYPDTVGTTWSLAIEKVREEAPAGASILNFCSYLASNDIPRSLIGIAGSYLPEESSTLFKDALAVTTGIKILNQYSLVNAQPDSISVHRLVQVVVRDRLKKEEQKLWAKAAAQTINAQFPYECDTNPNVWPECAALLSHAQVVTGHADEMEVTLEPTATLLNKMGVYLLVRASYSEAEPLFRRALEIRKAQLGTDHPDVAESLNDMAELLRAQGKYPDAEPLFRRALEIHETQLGTDHPSVATSLNNLALLLQAQGKYSDAEPLLRRALEIHETQLGADHPSVATSLNSLAELLRAQGKYPDAEPLFRRALEIREVQLGADHPSVATCLNNLALLLQAQDKYTDAEPLFRRALEIREVQLGADHPDVAAILNNLAALFFTQGKYPDAEPLFRRALEIVETQLKADHPIRNTVSNNLEKLLDKISKENNDEL